MSNQTEWIIQTTDGETVDVYPTEEQALEDVANLPVLPVGGYIIKERAVG